MRKLKHRLNRPRLRALAARSVNRDPVYGCRGQDGNCVALSFDDGPSAAKMGLLLELLEGYGARHVLRRVTGQTQLTAYGLLP